MHDKDDFLKNEKKYAKKRDRKMDPSVEWLDNYGNCDGYVNSVETALIAMAFSCIVSIILILSVERIKL